MPEPTLAALEMRGVIIRDGAERGGSGGLAFDLAEVLRALGSRVATSRWSCRNLSYVSRDEADIGTLDRAAAGESLYGDDLLATLPRLLQVIDGEFQGFADEPEPWVIIRAVDSSWWEVSSDDAATLHAIQAAFRVVDDLPA